MNPDTPQGLLNKVLFETIFYFCRRGRENIRELEASDFEIKVDADNRRYVVKVNKQRTIQGQQMKMMEMEVECMKLVE